MEPDDVELGEVGGRGRRGRPGRDADRAAGVDDRGDGGTVGREQRLGGDTELAGDDAPAVAAHDGVGAVRARTCRGSARRRGDGRRGDGDEGGERHADDQGDGAEGAAGVAAGPLVAADPLRAFDPVHVHLLCPRGRRRAADPRGDARAPEWCTRASFVPCVTKMTKVWSGRHTIATRGASAADRAGERRQPGGMFPPGCRHVRRGWDLNPRTTLKVVPALAVRSIRPGSGTSPDVLCCSERQHRSTVVGIDDAVRCRA